MPLFIAISGTHVVGPSWADVDRLVRGMFDTPGRLTRIARRDHGSNYRATSGHYDVTFTPDTGDAIEIELSVTQHAHALAVTLLEKGGLSR